MNELLKSFVFVNKIEPNDCNSLYLRHLATILTHDHNNKK
jgi:hypothetical protein